MESSAARRLGLIAVAAGLAAAVGLAGRRLVARDAHVDDAYRCGCGAEYRVQGADRHRIYWREGAPVLGDRCVACGAPLPAGHDGAVV
jgi:hypothetical protein